MVGNTQLIKVFKKLIINGTKFHSEFHSEEAPRIHVYVEKKASEWYFH
jgi:hypothetical protein